MPLNRATARYLAPSALLSTGWARDVLIEVSDDRSWLDGFDDIEEVGFDLHTLTLIMPEAR